MKKLSIDALANIIIGAVVVILLAVVLIAYPLATRSTVTATVTDKARITKVHDGNDTSFYLIYTDKETLRDSDSLVFFKFDSSDIYGRIQKGQTCTFRVYGLRIPFFSIYRNIVGADCR